VETPEPKRAANSSVVVVEGETVDMEETPEKKERRKK